MKDWGDVAASRAEALGENESSPRERIYDAALECFRRRGVRRTTMEDVAQQAHLSRPTIYYYFKDKQSLILEVVLRQQAESHRIHREKLAGSRNGLDAIIEAAVLGTERAINNPYTAELTRPENERLTALALQSPAARELQAAFWVPLFSDARERGELRDDLRDEDIIRWIIFLQFSIISNRDVFGLAEHTQIRETLDRFLAPALSVKSSAAVLPATVKNPTQTRASRKKRR